MAKNKWTTANIVGNETAKVMFVALLTNNDNDNEKVSFGASDTALSAYKANLVQELCLEIMDILSDNGKKNDH